jgi:hypothetical protein
MISFIICFWITLQNVQIFNHWNNILAFNMLSLFLCLWFGLKIQK